MWILKRTAQSLWKLPEGLPFQPQTPATITPEPPVCRPQTKSFQFHPEPAPVAHEPIATGLVTDFCSGAQRLIRNSITVKIKRRRRLMWGGGAYSSTHKLFCKHQNPVAWKNSKTAGEGCSYRGLPELPNNRSPPYARPQHGVF